MAGRAYPATVFGGIACYKQGMASPRPPRLWELEHTQRRGDYRVFTVDALTCRRAAEPGEQPHDPHTFFRINSASWVNVIAKTPQGAYILVRQFRQGSRALTLEIPGGLVDEGEDPQTAAARELEEETGYRPQSIRKLGEVNPNPALFANRVHTYLAEGCTHVAEIKNDSAEETVVELRSLEELHQAVREGEVDHAIVMAALYWETLDRG